MLAFVHWSRVSLYTEAGSIDRTRDWVHGNKRECIHCAAAWAVQWLDYLPYGRRNVFRYRAGARYFFSSPKQPEQLWGLQSLLFKWVPGPLSLVVKWPEREPNHSNLVLRLRMCGAVPSFPYTPAWRAQGQLHLRFLYAVVIRQDGRIPCRVAVRDKSRWAKLLTIRKGHVTYAAKDWWRKCMINACMCSRQCHACKGRLYTHIIYLSIKAGVRKVWLATFRCYFMRPSNVVLNRLYIVIRKTETL
jgi:hypothetical protein